MRKFTFSWTVLALLILGAITVQAQTKGSLGGTVTDATGAVVPGANVEIKNNANGATRTGSTASNGVFQFTDVEPGTYTLTVQSSGFKKTVASNVVVNTSVASQVTIALETGQVSETVTVTDAQEVINTSSPTLTNVINTRQIVDLPLPDRNPLNLAALQAGIAVVGGDTRGSSVAGLRQTATNVTQDGINAMDNFVKTSSFFAISTPSLNATAEFSITTGTTSSEQGRGVAQVNMVTKSGSNQFHGGGFLQIINDAYNSNTFFNNFNGISKPVLRQHYWGGDIGGPVYFPNFGDDGPKIFNGKDKAFFYFSFERFVQNQAAARNRNGVLTQSALAGNFQYTCAATSTDPNCPANTQKTVNLLALSTVPFHSLNPVMTAHLAQIPLPNNSACSNNDGFNIGCFAFNVPELTTNNKYVIRYDHFLVKSSRFGTHKLEFVFSRVDTSTHPDVFTNGVEAPFPGGVNAFQASNRNLATPALVSTFGSNWTNVFRYGRQWAPVVFDRDTQPTAPFLSLPGVLVNYDNANMPQPRNTIVNQFTDTLSWVHGNHLWKFGGDFQRVLVKSYNSAGINETIQLSGTSTANGTGITLASLPGGSNALVTNAQTVYAAIVGLLGSASQTLNVTSPDSGFVPGATRFRTFQEQDLALFAQDQWRIKSNFTLNFGVRWDFMGVPTVPNGLSIQPNYSDLFGVSGFGNLFHPTAPAGVPPGIATQQFVSGDTGIPLFKNDWNNFAPYIGFAYSPNFKSGPLHFIFGDEGKSSIRAGYSIAYLHDGLTTISNALGTGTTNPGLIQTANLSQLSCPAANPGCTHTSNLLGQLGPGGVPLDIPAFIMPITDRQNILLNTTNGLWAIDPNLRSPYVEQWNIGIEREIFKDTALEVRYVGNRGVRLWRAVDFNEVNIFENGFLQEFNNAKTNLAARGGSNFAPGCGGCVPTPILDKLFTGLAGTSASGYGSSTFISNLNNNNIGTMASTLAFNATYRANRENPALGIPMNFFVANPNAAFARGLSNDATSDYNAMEVELRRRFSQGLQFQADYTWSKAMGNATDAQGNNQSDLVNWITLRDKSLDHRRSTQDQTQRFVANALYELPFGRSKPFFSSVNGWADRAIGGWSIGAIATFATGTPWYVAAGRASFNSQTTNNGAQLVGISFEDFKKNVGQFRTAGGVFYINPDLLDITTSPTTGKVTSSKLKAGLMTAPAPGTLGNFPLNSLSAPDYFDLDMSVIKRIPITEGIRLEFKVSAINVLNHTNFIYATQNFDSTSFGQITSQRASFGTTIVNTRSMNFLVNLRF